MSKIVSIITQFRDVEVLVACLEHFECQVLHQERGIQMPGTQTLVQLLAHAPFGTLGFRLTAAGNYEIAADELLLNRRQDFIKQLTQQYAYRKILKDAASAGYALVREEIGDDQTVRLVVRKWEEAL